MNKHHQNWNRSDWICGRNGRFQRLPHCNIHRKTVTIIFRGLRERVSFDFFQSFVTSLALVALRRLRLPLVHLRQELALLEQEVEKHPRRISSSEIQDNAKRYERLLPKKFRSVRTTAKRNVIRGLEIQLCADLPSQNQTPKKQNRQVTKRATHPPK
jgi:hypothetical protein